MARKKTKAEKIESGYRLKNFSIAASERTAVKDASEFGYLSSEYVVKDLMKTLVFTGVIVALLILAKMKLG
ncbi:MAG: hypothetical protein WAV40_01965 [Microgenomates group bacterium]